VAVSGGFNTMKNAVSGAISGIVSAVSGGFNTVVSKVTTVMNAVIDTVKGFVNRMVSVGTEIINGLIQGIANGRDAVINTMKDIAGGAIDTVKNFLGIHSPSKVFKEIGGNTIQGLIDGIYDKKSAAMNANLSVVKAIVDTQETLKQAQSDLNAEMSKKEKDRNKDTIANLQQQINNSRYYLDTHKDDQKSLSDFIKSEQDFRNADSIQKAKMGGKSTMEAWVEGANSKKASLQSALSDITTSINSAFTSALSIRTDAQGSIVKDIVDAKEKLKTTQDAIAQQNIENQNALNAELAKPADKQDADRIAQLRKEGAEKITALEKEYNETFMFLERHKKDQTDLTAFIKKEEEFRAMDSIQQTKFRMNEQLKQVQDGLKAQISAFKKAFKDLAKDKEIKKMFGSVDNFAKIFGNFGQAVSVQSIPGFAGGVENFSGGIAMVGGNGPEMVRLPRGASVTPNHEISSAGGVHVENHFHNPVLRQESDFEKLASMVKNSINRDAQLANKGI